MRNTLRFGAVLVASYLAGTAGWAYGQTGAGNQSGGGAAGVGGRESTTTSSSLVTAPGNLEQQANEDAANRAATARSAVTGQPAASPAVPGATPPANTYQTPGMTNSGINPAAGATNPGTAGPLPPGTPGEWNYRSSNPTNTYAPGTYPGTSTAATPGYTNRVMPGMAGYNAVNPMPTTMAPGYYYADTAGMPYATYNNQGAGNSPYGYGATTAYPSTYAPGTYVGGAPGYVVQRRGLFGRRSRVAYPAGSYGYSGYGTSPSGYSTYGTTTYYSTPGTYTYGAYPR